jgi:hypothetical protein
LAALPVTQQPTQQGAEAGGDIAFTAVGAFLGLGLLVEFAEALAHGVVAVVQEFGQGEGNSG